MCCESEEKRKREEGRMRWRIYLRRWKKAGYCYLQGDGAIFDIYISYTLEYGLLYDKQEWNCFLLLLFLLLALIFEKRKIWETIKNVIEGEA